MDSRNKFAQSSIIIKRVALVGTRKKKKGVLVNSLPTSVKIFIFALLSLDAVTDTKSVFHMIKHSEELKSFNFSLVGQFI